MNDLVDAMAVEARDKEIELAAREKESAEQAEAAAGPAAPWDVDGAIVVTGATELSPDQLDELTVVIEGLDPSQDALISGLRRGSELSGAEVAVKNGVPLGVVLPFADPARNWPKADKMRFDACMAQSKWTITLEGDESKPATAVAGRDRWLWSRVVGAIIVGDSARIEELEEAGLGVIEVGGPAGRGGEST